MGCGLVNCWQPLLYSGLGLLVLRGKFKCLTSEPSHEGPSGLLDHFVKTDYFRTHGKPNYPNVPSPLVTGTSAEINFELSIELSPSRLLGAFAATWKALVRSAPTRFSKLVVKLEKNLCVWEKAACVSLECSQRLVGDFLMAMLYQLYTQVFCPRRLGGGRKPPKGHTGLLLSPR